MVRLQVTKPVVKGAESAAKSSPKANELTKIHISQGKTPSDGGGGVSIPAGVRNIDDLQIDECKFDEVMEELKAKLKRHKTAPAKNSEAAKPKDQNRAMTDDGLYIYSAEELRIGQKGSGMTALCPFDCNCCF